MNDGSVSASPCHRSAPQGTGSLRNHEFGALGAQDCGAIAALIACCPPLDPNSIYCNLLQATHFAPICIKAERRGPLDGWISGYRLPEDPEAMFVRQVAMHERARGLAWA